MSEQLFSEPIERHVLSGLCKFPEVFADLEPFIKSSDFFHQTHGIIYSVIQHTLEKSEKLDQVILAQKLQNLNIILKDDINIFDYISNLYLSNINKDGAMMAAQELVKLRVCREMYNVGKTIQETIIKNRNKSVDDIISITDQTYHEKLLNHNINKTPIDLFGNMEEYLMNAATNPVEEIGLMTPFEQFNKLFGGLRAGNGIYAVVSRPKEGKSSMLAAMAEGVIKRNPGCKALILDTEMNEEVAYCRMGSAYTQVPMWYLETGNWTKNRDLVDKFQKGIQATKEMKGKLFHLKVANTPVEEICAIMRRWYFNTVGRGNKAFIVYDYIKLTGENLTNNWAEHQAIGEKINRLNEVGWQLNIPIFSAMQLNRSAEFGVDDSSAIAISDRLQWFAAFIGLFRRKKLEELADDGPEFGTHKMIPLAYRFQGKEGFGHHDIVKIPLIKDTKKDDNKIKRVIRYNYKHNYINYGIKNFKVEEYGTLRDITDKQQEHYKLDDNENVEIEEL